MRYIAVPVLLAVVAAFLAFVSTGLFAVLDITV